jgi:hypothetical protein
MLELGDHIDERRIERRVQEAELVMMEVWHGSRPGRISTSFSRYL